MSERTMWVALRPHLVLHGLAERVENLVVPGMADVNACFAGAEVWIELKEIERDAPNGRPFVIPHFTVVQRQWHRTRARAGSKTFVLLHIRLTREWLLWPGDVAADRVAIAPGAACRALALAIAPSPAALAKFLIFNQLRKV